MSTISIDEKLLAEARKLGKHRSNNEAAQAALRDYVRIKKQLEIVPLFGKIEYHADYDHKAARRRNRR